MDKQITNLCAVLLDLYGIDLSVFEEYFLVQTIEKLLVEKKIIHISDYINLLKQNPQEAKNLKHRLLIDYSKFFRQTIAFAYLEELLLPSLLDYKAQNGDAQLRIWSAGCAKGEEAYSVAILLDEFSKRKKSTINYRIFATDINKHDIKYIHRHSFDISSVKKVSIQRLNEYFNEENGTYKIREELYKHIDFSVFDLLDEKLSCPSESIYGNFDLIFCSNFLFYYKPSEYTKIINKVSANLDSNGYVITSDSERNLFIENGFKEVFLYSGIFRRARSGKTHSI